MRQHYFISGSSPTNACVQVDQKGLAAMLVIKNSAGVASDVILWNPLHEREEAGKQGIHYDFESQGKQH